jgi:predicted nucleotidyltransferase
MGHNQGSTEASTLIALIESNCSAISKTCRQYGVQRFAVFGSAVRGTVPVKTPRR